MRKLFLFAAALAITAAATGCKGTQAQAEAPVSIAEEAINRPDTFASDSELLDFIQKVHFNYMWEGADRDLPTSASTWTANMVPTTLRP